MSFNLGRAKMPEGSGFNSVLKPFSVEFMFSMAVQNISNGPPKVDWRLEYLLLFPSPVTTLMAFSPPEIEYYLSEMEIINRAEHSGALNITKRADSLTKADLTEILPHKASISSGLEGCQTHSGGNGDIFIKFTESADFVQVVQRCESRRKLSEFHEHKRFQFPHDTQHLILGRHSLHF